MYDGGVLSASRPTKPANKKIDYLLPSDVLVDAVESSVRRGTFFLNFFFF